jgi:hypothetical protein
MKHSIRQIGNLVLCASLFVLAPRGSLGQTGGATGDWNREAPAAAATLGDTPMTSADRFHHYVNQLFSADSVFRSANGSAILQGVDAPHDGDRAPRAMPAASPTRAAHHSLQLGLRRFQPAA